jgi:hypothetical protein
MYLLCFLKLETEQPVRTSFDIHLLSAKACYYAKVQGSQYVGSDLS